MKKAGILLTAALVCCACFGCKAIYTQTLDGAWTIDTYKYDGSVETTSYSITHKDYQITFNSKSGTFSETYTVVLLPVGISGTWEIDKKADGKIGEFQLQLTDETNGVRNYDIVKITSDTINIKRSLENGHTEEIFLEPVE